MRRSAIGIWLLAVVAVWAVACGEANGVVGEGEGGDAVETPLAAVTPVPPQTTAEQGATAEPAATTSPSPTGTPEVRVEPASGDDALADDLRAEVGETTEANPDDIVAAGRDDGVLTVWTTWSAADSEQAQELCDAVAGMDLEGLGDEDGTLLDAEPISDVVIADDQADEILSCTVDADASP